MIFNVLKIHRIGFGRVGDEQVQMLVEMLDRRCQVDVGRIGMLPDVEQHAKRFASGVQQIFQVFCLTWMQGVWCAFGHLSFHLT